MERARSGIMDASTSSWQRTLLLWPSPDAEPLEQVAASLDLVNAWSAEADSDVVTSGSAGSLEGGVLLVLLDGTWPSCGQMLQKSEILRGLRTVSISPAGESLYAIRMEPSPEARSTLEAAAHSLAVLGGGARAAQLQAHASCGNGAVVRDGGTHAHEGHEDGAGEVVRDALLCVLVRMVELQCAHITNPKHRKVDAKNYRANRYNIAAVAPPHLRGGGAAEVAQYGNQSTSPEVLLFAFSL